VFTTRCSGTTGCICGSADVNVAMTFVSGWLLAHALRRQFRRLSYLLYEEAQFPLIRGNKDRQLVLVNRKVAADTETCANWHFFGYPD
jgi:hypothetical protein